MRGLKCYFNSLWFIFTNNRTTFIISCAFYVISGVIPYLNVSAISYIIQEAEKIAAQNMAASDTNVFLGISLLALFIFLDRMIMLGQMPLLSVMSFRVVTKINVLIAEKTNRMPYASIESTEFQNKLQAVRNFANRLPELFTISLNTLRALCTIGTLVFKFSQNFYLLLIIAAASLPSLLLSFRLTTEEHQLELQLTQDQRIAAYYQDLLSNSAYVKEKYVFQLKELLMNRWQKTAARINQTLFDFELKSMRWDLVGGAFNIAAYLVPLILVLHLPDVSAAEFLALSAAILSIQNAFQALVANAASLQGQVLNDAVVLDFLNAQEENQEFQYRLDGPIQEIAFENVSFSYQGSKEKALDDVTVSLTSGETIVVIGANGAGKSTFLKLILGLYKPQEGAVTCNGLPTHLINRDCYFPKISAILQEYNKYPMTIAQNIDVFADEQGPPSAAVISAAEACGIHDWITSLPAGYNTLLTHLRPNGREISGGQWQKIAVARGLLKNAELFILDEPTSSLDPLKEAEILDMFINLPTRALKIIVTHRVGIAAKADRILVFDGGKLVEVGKHDELLRTNGVYTKLYNVQKQWYAQTQYEGEMAL